ncbi:MAG TPA: hypothetical protein VI454_13330, partial [Verrucomicrobiae bacterium]
GLGDAGASGWAADAGEAIPEQDYHSAAALVHFTFIKPLDDLPGDVALEFLFFDELGERHTVLGTFELEGKPPYEITFTRFEPDYLFDTGYEPTLARRLVVLLKRGWPFALLVLVALLWLLQKRRRVRAAQIA